MAIDLDMSAAFEPVVGMAISALLLDCGVVLKVGLDWEVEIRIESDFEILGEGPPITVHFSPCVSGSEGPAGLTLLAQVIGSHVVSAERSASGGLVVELDTTVVRMISVPGDDKYESWSFTHGTDVVTGMRY